MTAIGGITEAAARKATAGGGGKLSQAMVDGKSRHGGPVLTGRGGKLSQAMVDGKSRHGGPVLTGRLVEDMGKVRGDRFLAED